MKNLFINLKTALLNQKSDTHKRVAKILLRNTLRISVAESCTGGLISSRLTDVAGSSAYTNLNLVTYSNEYKKKYLNVSEETLLIHGAVSSECAAEMAQGLQKLTGNDIILCTTGVAGPDFSENKPAGLLYCACSFNGETKVKEFKLNPKLNRKNMKFRFSEEALKMVLEMIEPLEIEV